MPFSEAYEVRDDSFVGDDTPFANVEGIVDWDSGEQTEFDIDPFGVETVVPDEEPGVESGDPVPEDSVVEAVEAVETEPPKPDPS